MPEGHTIHRYARLHREALGGATVRASSPQGRFTDGAARLDGATLEGVDAYGKHLFYRFAPTGTLHVHLGLFGRFRLFHADAPPPTPGTRLALTAGDGTTLYLAGATAVELIDGDAEQSLLARLGPDPLRADRDPPCASPVGGAATGTGVERFAAALRRRTVGIGQALLDQRAVAGVGNVYRSEALFLEGIHPDTSARSLDAGQVVALWGRITTLLQAGERAGRIVTVEAADRDGPPSQLRRGAEALYVYQRDGLPCRRCDTPVTSWQLGGRSVFACLQHQPPPQE